MQIDALRTYAARRGWQVTIEAREVGSGASERPKREQLMKAARQRELDAVLVWRLDRWGRSLPDLVVSLRELGELGIGFVSLTEALDLTTPTGRAVAGVLAVFAEFERDILRDRVKAGIAQARKEGRRIGRPPLAESIRAEARRLFAEDVSKAEIARRLSISRPTVRRLTVGIKRKGKRDELQGAARRRRRR